MGKNIGLLLLSFTVIFAGTTFTLALDANESTTSDSGLVQGHTTMIVTDENGYVKSYAQSDNAIVVNGMTTLVQETFGAVGAGGVVTGNIGSSTGPVTHMGIGTGSVTAIGSDSTLTTITGCDRSAATFTSGGASNNAGNFATITVRAAASFSGGAIDGSCSAVADIREAGMFNEGTTAGEMFARNVFGAVTELGASDTLDITWDFTFTGTT